MTQAAFLGVNRSLSGRRWRQRGGDDRMGLALAQRLGVPEIVGRVIAARGIGLDAAEQFLAPTLRDMLPDPASFKDMDRAVERIVQAIERGETIAIFGDYDVDGATSTALLRRFLAAVGGKSMTYIPDRQREGYGPNIAALLRLKEQGAGLVVTVDCGIAAHAPLAAAARAGLDVIVVDHHVGEPELPAAVAVINPNRLDESGAHGTLAAVGVAFLLTVGVNRALRQRGWYRDRAEPDLMSWLDLVALGTICDVVPLTGVNRALVVQGLKVMRRRNNVGLAALADVAGVTERLDAYHAGFVLGPRVNAGGRVGEAELGARLLASDDPVEARALAQRLDAFNRERREIEAGVLAEAIALVEAVPSRSAIIVAARDGWHQGVIGIVAGRLRERYNRPACVITLDGAVGKGSGRSVPGVALGPAIIAARQAGLLASGGGHDMAAGFTVAREGLDALRAFLENHLRQALDGVDLAPELGIDGVLAPAGATLDLASMVEGLGPFGTGNSEPRFVLANARVLHAEPVAGQHLRIVLGDPAGAGRIKAMLFRADEGSLGAALLNARGTALHVAGKLRIDRWQGREEPRLLVDDAAAVS
ncbi:MAG TPA: single-stranded-DNA-specific exonuclease RecJ [Stellaceae bacterium]|nr:single-stranded-DNA-specific exonuclease RecJ [Stellaceae bacterium]